MSAGRRQGRATIRRLPRCAWCGRRVAEPCLSAEMSATCEEPTPTNCAACGGALPEAPHGGPTGYAVRADGKMICYPCAAHSEQLAMIETGHAVLYLVDSNASTGRAWTAQNWTGHLTFPVLRSTRSRHNIGGTRIDVWFTGPDGALWYGVNIGDNQILRCKRLKGK